jgi:hypothetical protein
MPSSERVAAPTASASGRPAAAPIADTGPTLMRAVAVFPGTPNSMHLARLPKPSIADVPGGRGVLVKVLRVGAAARARGPDSAFGLRYSAFLRHLSLSTFDIPSTFVPFDIRHWRRPYDLATGHCVGV